MEPPTARPRRPVQLPRPPRSPWHLPVLLLAAVYAPAAVDGKVQEVRVKLGTGARSSRTDWQYIGKFGFDVGKGSWSIKLKERFPQGLASNTSFDVDVYLDEQWPQVEAEPDPCKRHLLAKRREKVIVGDRRSFGPPATGTVRQMMRPHVWYFAVSDCNRTLGEGSAVVTAEFEALNPDNSHFSVEAKWAPFANTLGLVGFTFALGYFGKRAMSFRKSNGTVHPVIWTLLAVLVTQYLAQCFHTGHLLLYRRNGRGSLGLELLSELFFVACHITQTSLWILIASGYTLLQANLGDLDIVLLVCFMAAVVHAALVVLDKVQEDVSSKFTDHDGWKGWGFALLRLALLVWFSAAVSSTSKAAGLRVRTFLRKFQAVGSVYFLSFPVLLLAMPIFAPYVRRPVMELTLMAVQVGSNAWLAHLFLSRGAFFEVSSLSASPLPGAGSPVRFFKDD